MALTPVMGSHSYRESEDYGPGRCHYCSLPTAHHLYGVPEPTPEVTMTEASKHCTHCPEGCTDEHPDTCAWGCQDG